MWKKTGRTNRVLQLTKVSHQAALPLAKKKPEKQRQHLGAVEVSRRIHIASL
jgi:hypothetical protein